MARIYHAKHESVLNLSRAEKSHFASFWRFLSGAFPFSLKTRSATFNTRVSQHDNSSVSCYLRELHFCHQKCLKIILITAHPLTNLLTSNDVSRFINRTSLLAYICLFQFFWFVILYNIFFWCSVTPFWDRMKF